MPLNIVKASAGSGKTYRLALQYLKLALQFDLQTAKRAENLRNRKTQFPFRNILATTFTNKAAGEMKSRIIKFLDALAYHPEAEKGMVSHLKEQLQIDDNELQGRAKMALAAVMHNYSEFSISTIDSFIHKIVRAFSLDLELSSGFEVVLDKNEMLHSAIEMLIDDAGTNEDVTQVLIEFIESKLEEGEGWNIRKDIASFAAELFNDDSFRHIKNLETLSTEQFREIHKGIYRTYLAFQIEVRTVAEEVLQLLRKHGIEVEDLSYGNRGIYGFFNRLADKSRAIDANALEPNSYVKKLMNDANAKWESGKSKVSKATLTQIAPKVLDALHAILKLRDEKGHDYFLADILLQSFYSFRLVNELYHRLQEYKKENNVVHLSEFYPMINRIVATEDTPYIYERIGEKFSSVMIDEFQDTSVLQWQNLLPLVENAQFQNGESLIVGDGKQAIYRWRGGEAQQFIALPNVYGSDADFQLKMRETAINNYGADVTNLGFNFRSSNEIIDFNNKLYNYVSEPAVGFEKRIVYENQEQKAGKNIPGGYITIDLLKKEVYPEKTDVRQARLELVKKYLDDAREKGYRWKDIAVIVRKNSLGAEIAKWMMARLIPVVSSESLQLKSSQHVNLLMASLKYIVDTNDTLARREMTDFAAEIFKRPILIQADNKKLSRLEFENSFNKALQIDFSPEKLSNNTIYNMALVLCKCFNFVVTTNPFLLKWLDQILEASKKNIRSLPDLIDWWNDKGQNISITFPDNLDAVRILTVHKSKGLEYPVVILPEFTEAPKNNSTRYVWVSPDKEWLKPVSSCILPVRKSLLHTEFYEIWEEEVRNRALDIINIMYVSTTRASDRLHIIASESKISSNIQAENSFNLLKSFLENQSQDEPQSHYEFGDPKTGNREQHTDAGESFFDASNLLHTAVVDRKLHVRITPERFIESSRLMRMERGSLLHRLMSISTSKTDIANNVKHFVAAGLITSTESEEIKKHCESVFDLDALKPYLTDDWIAINERAILTNDGSLIPDRVLLQKDTRNAVVVDFKTGGINASYSQQLEKYAAAIEGLGYNVLEKLLVYIDEGKAVAVKE